MKVAALAALLAATIGFASAPPGGAQVPDAPRFSAAATPLPPSRDSRLQETIEYALRTEYAIFGVAIEHLETGEAAAIHSERVFEAASLYKLAVLYEVYRQQRAGRIAWDTSLAVTQRHLALELVSSWAALGRAMTVAEATEAMITRSDNTAAALLWTRLGLASINQGMVELGLLHTRLDYEVSTTAADMARWFALAYRGELVDAEASADILAQLARQQVNDRLPALLPAGTRVAHKTGDLPGLTHDVGIVYAPSGPFVLAVLSAWSARSLAPRTAIARLSRQVYDYFETRDTDGEPALQAGVRRSGAAGWGSREGERGRYH
jgi:beta-lactamase class A